MNGHEGKPLRILLIEDDPETAEYIVVGLQNEMHDLEVAFDGRAGLLRAASETWDLLIVDRMLPGLDGLASDADVRQPDFLPSCMPISGSRPEHDHAEQNVKVCDKRQQGTLAFRLVSLR
jgi:DNA-binding response OmpR family regulator